MTNRLSDKFFKKVLDFLGCEYPFICGAMTWGSDPKLVAAVEDHVKSGSLMAGQSVGLINKSESVKDIIDDLVNETNKEFELIKSMLS